MEIPFTEQEKRFVLAEAIKTSSLPLEKLLALLSDGNIQPAWAEMQIPLGRNLNQCVLAFENLRAGPAVASSRALPPTSISSHKRKSAASELVDPLTIAPAPKRRQSGTNIITRELQPKPASNGSPNAFLTPTAGTTTKKRGRPSKAAVEQRQAEAIARGEVLPPPKTATPKGGRQPSNVESSMSGGFAVIAPTPKMDPPPAAEASSPIQFEGEQAQSSTGGDSSKKKRARPTSKSSKVFVSPVRTPPVTDGLQKAPKPGEGSFSILNPAIGEPGHEGEKHVLALHEPLRVSRPVEGGGGDTTQPSASAPSESQTSTQQQRPDK